MSTASQPIRLIEPPRLSVALRLALLLAPLLLAFWPTLSSFPDAWLNRGGSGFVVAAFTCYLLWRERAALLQPERGFGLAALAIGALSLVWLAAVVLNVRVLHQAAVPIMLLLWVLAALGAGPFLKALPITGVFFLAVPLWGVLTRPLQSMTVVVNGLLLSVGGIDAVIEGDHIQIPSGIFWVASGCAGLNYFETGLLVSVMYSLLFLRAWRARAVAVAVALFLSLISNWLRVFGLIVIGHVTKMQSPLIADHGTYGWLIFAGTMAVFFLLARRIERYDAGLMSGSPRESSRTVRAGTTPTWTTLMIPTLAAAIGPLFFLALGGRDTSGVPAPTLPSVAPDSSWTRIADTKLVAGPLPASRDTGETAAPAFWVPGFRGASGYRSERWVRDGSVVEALRVFYRDQAQGRELVSDVNVIAPADERIAQQLLGPIDESGRRVSVTAVRTDAGARLVWHWYRVAGVDTHSAFEAKLLELVAFVQSAAPPAELVAISTPCGAQDCNQAMRTLHRFVLGRELLAPPSGR
jgi:EpsI family protein